MLGNRHDKLRAGVLEQLRPLVGVIVLRREHGDEVLVTEFGVVAPGLAVMFKRRVILQVHAPRVPLVAKSQHAVRSPMDEDAELGVDIPLGNFVLLQGFPSRFVFFMCSRHSTTPI